MEPVAVPDRPEVIARFLATGPDTPWLVAGYIAARDGRLFLDQISIEAETETPAGGITSTTLRKLSLPQILAAAEYALTERPDWFDLLERHHLGVVPAADYANAQQTATATAAAGRSHPGRPRRPDALLVWTARTYLGLLRLDVRRGILIELAKLATEREKRPITRETVRDWVKAARDRGYLEGGLQGRAGARPGPRLQALTPADDLVDECDRQTSPALLRRSSGANVSAQRD